MGLLLSVGLPFFVLATTAPLLQSWFARSDRDPYWLYAASNAGSLLGLIAYPFFFERYFPLATQRHDWCIGFLAVVVAIGLCGFVAAHWHRRETPVVESENGTVIAPARRLRWLGLSALTTSLLASVTAHLSTDIAPMPLLWVVPLSLYLLTYIVAFSHWPERARQFIGRFAPMAICFAAIALMAKATEPIAIVAAVHLVGLTAICFLCHGELATDKPSPKHLTDFYLCLARWRRLQRRARAAGLRAPRPR